MLNINFSLSFNIFITLIFNPLIFAQDLTPKNKYTIKRFVEAKKREDINDLIGLNVFTNRVTTSGEEVWSFLLKPTIVADKKMGYKNSKSRINVRVDRTKNELIFNSTFTTDKFRRRTYLNNVTDLKQFFLVNYGCSFVFGVGLNDNQTLPYFIDINSKVYESYNYGTDGLGSHMMLAHLESTLLNKQITQREGIFLYHFIAEHINRTNGFMQELAWLKDTPAYLLDGDHLRTETTFEKAFPIRTQFYGLLRRYFPLEFFGITNFPKISQKHLDLTCKIIVKSRDTFKAQFPLSKFLFINHPLSREPLSQQLKKCLIDNSISIVKLTLDLQNEKDRIPLDGHPSVTFNSKYAKSILHYLNVSSEYE